MRNLKCPQCDIHRFYVKNTKGDSCLVTVNEFYEVVPVKDESLEGFDLSTLYCLGCSWKGSPKSLKSGSHKM